MLEQDMLDTPVSQVAIPSTVLTILGALLAVLGLFVGGAVELVVIGLVSIFAAGLLGVLAIRRS
jgi:hypothetical protein